MNCETARALLSAELDGELDLRQSLELEEHSRLCAGCSQERARLRNVSQALHSTPALRFSAPADLEEEIRAALRLATNVVITNKPARRHYFGFRWWLEFSPSSALATVALLLFLGFCGGYFWKRPSLAASDAFTREAVASHVRSLLADHLLDVVSSDQHTVKPWFNGRLDFAPPVSDLAAAGFPLAGGRLDYLDSRSAAALVYRHDKHVINLFVQPAATGENSNTAWPLRAASREGFHLLQWTDHELSFCAVSDLNETDLRRFAEAARQSYR